MIADIIFLVKIKILCQAHAVQLQAFALCIKKLNVETRRPKLQVVGSCRNDADETRLQNLKDLAIELMIEEDVEFHKNVSYRFVSLHIISLLSLVIKLFYFLY